MKTFLTSDAGEGGDPIQPAPAPQPSSSPQPAPPPAATVVANATKNERELQLEADLDRERKEKKDREMRINQLEDENHQLKSVPTIKTPAVPEEEYRWRPYKL